MVITISRQFGAGGSLAARRVAAALGWEVVDNEVIERVAARAGVSAEAVAERDERVPGFVERLTSAIVASAPPILPPAAEPPPDEESLVRLTGSVVAEAAARGRVVMVGRAAPVVIGLEHPALHVKLVAPREHRGRAAAERLGLDEAAAARRVDDTDRNRARYHREHYGRDWDDPLHYHVVLNTGLLGVDGAADLIVAAARLRGWGGAQPSP